MAAQQGGGARGELPVATQYCLLPRNKEQPYDMVPEEVVETKEVVEPKEVVQDSRKVLIQ